MGYTTDLLSGIAQLLHDDGVGVWRPAGAYAEDEVGIVVGVLRQSPASQIALQVYASDDDPALSDSTAGMQVRVRSPDAGTVSADDLSDGVFDTLQGLHGVDLSTGIRLVYADRLSRLPLSIDGSGRQERIDNYDLQAHRPSQHRE